MPQHFDLLGKELNNIKELKQNPDATGFFLQEVLRFYSIAGTLLTSDICLTTSSTVDGRYLTHVLSRALLEPYFTILYIFDDFSLMSARYEEQKNTFKDNYRKLMNDLNKPEWSNFMTQHGNKLEPADPTWKDLKKLPDVNTMLGYVKNHNGGTLQYLYPLYRITSFDTHGRSLGTIFESVFGKQCNFPILDIEYAIELMANEYLSLYNNLRTNKLI